MARIPKSGTTESQKDQLRMKLIEAQKSVERVHQAMTGILEELDEEEAEVAALKRQPPATGTDV